MTPPASSARVALRHVLPPRTSGPLALLDAAPDADVLAAAHVGLEGVTHFRNAWRGDLISRHIRVRFWRIPSASVPKDRAPRVEWLFDVWERVDAWIDAQSRGREHLGGNGTGTTV